MTIKTQNNSTKYGAKTYKLNQGKGTFIGPAYEGFKSVAKIYGYYEQVRPYLPEERFKDIYRKPVTTSLDFQRGFQKIFPKKAFRSNKVNQKFCKFSDKYRNNSSKSNYCYSNSQSK